MSTRTFDFPPSGSDTHGFQVADKVIVACSSLDATPFIGAPSPTITNTSHLQTIFDLDSAAWTGKIKIALKNGDAPAAIAKADVATYFKVELLSTGDAHNADTNPWCLKTIAGAEPYYCTVEIAQGTVHTKSFFNLPDIQTLHNTVQCNQQATKYASVGQRYTGLTDGLQAELGTEAGTNAASKARRMLNYWGSPDYFLPAGLDSSNNAAAESELGQTHADY